jgi:subtilisin family serine protease
MKITRLTLVSAFVLVFFSAWGLDSASGEPNGQAVPEGRYIVVFRDGLAWAQAASAQAAGVDRRSVRAEFRSAFKGFAAELTTDELTALRRNPAVAFVEPDLEVTIFDQVTPTGVDRIETDFNNTANIDGVNDPMDVDIAIIDTGVDLDHPDLNVVFSVNCTVSDPLNPADPCVEGSGDDDHSHGSHVAGIAAAIDNNIGVVGVAPGARIWSIKSLGSSGTGYVSHVLKGVEWVTAHNQAASSEDEIIDVVNMSLGWTGHTDAGRLAIQNSVAEGVVYVVAAGNDSRDIYGADGVMGTSDDTEPASYPEVMTIAALNDSDGEPGGVGSFTGWGSADRNGDGVADGVDDSFLWMSNFSNQVVAGNPVTSSGEAIDLILPGADIFSTSMNGGYTTKSGTSMATPHAAGLAALYIVRHGRDVNGDTFVDEQDVYAIRQSLVDSGVPQAGPSGLAVQNDPDGNREGLGWAEDATSASPTADAGGPYVTDEGSAVVFDGTGSSDSDGSVVTYIWDYDYDGVTLDSQGSSANPQFIYIQDGSYTAALQVIDNDGLPSGISTAPVTVNNVGPTANAGGPYSVNFGDDVNLNASASSDPGQDITDYEWDLDDDGQYDDASGATFLFSPSSPGVMEIGVRVTDSNGSSDADSTTITVSSNSVLASIEVSPSSANLSPDETQQFTANLFDQFGAPFTDEVSATTVSEDPSLVGSWKLDEGTGTVAGDSSSNGIDGTVNGGAQWIAGQAGSALGFDGSNDYVSIPYTTDLQEWTVAAWVRSPDAPSPGPASGPVYRDQNFFINWDHPAAGFRGSAGMRVSGQWYSASFGTLSANTWYHLAATYDGDTLRAYRDGALVASNTAPSGPPDAENDSLAIGRHSGTSQYFEGDVDEVLVYSRALADQEVNALSAASASSFAPGPSGLTASSLEQGVELAWDAPNSGEVSSYRVYRAVTSGGEKTLIAQVPGALSDYLDMTAIPGATYFYEITALDDTISSSSNEASATFEPPVAIDADPSLVGSWKFDEGAGAVAGDSSGNGLDGTIDGGAQWIAGQSGSALGFDGSDDYVSVPFTTDLPEWTIAAWVRGPTPPASGPSTGPIVRDMNFNISWDHPAAAFRGVATMRVAGQWYTASFGALSGDTWYHLAASYDGETLRAYRDGSLVASNTSPSGPPDTENDPLTFGRHSGFANFFEGPYRSGSQQSLGHRANRPNAANRAFQP